MKEDIRTVEFASLLYDFYGSLLTENQEEVMNLYHEDNLSLSEIAEELGMSRQAVHYTLKKAENALEQYESRLGLLRRYRENEKRLEELQTLAEKLLKSTELSDADRQAIRRMQQLAGELSE